jgi:O-antigen/teichoic acid export membrane protein/2-polyprenyl-3-methyl-5-hydroxy-6-metoxy-1,4-benzoquinol methylase
MTNLKRTATGFFWNQVGRTAEYILIFLFSALIARKLGAETNGIYASIMSVVYLLMTFSSFGLETVVASNFPKSFKDLTSAGGTFKSLLIFRICLSIVVSIAFILLRKSIIQVLHVPPTAFDYFFIIAFYFILRNITSLFTATLIAFFETRLVSIISFFIRLVELITAFVLISTGFGLYWIFLLITATSLLQIVLFSITAKSLLFSSTTETNPSRPLISLGGKFWLNSILEFLLGKQADILLLGIFMISLKDIGYFDVAFGFSQTINLGLTMGFYGVSVAAFSSIESRENRLIKNYFETINRFVLIIIIPAFVFSAFFAKEIISFIYSTDYQNSILIFQIFTAVLIITRILGGGLAADYLQSRGETKKLLATSGISGATNILLAIVLIPIWGLFGAVVATGSAALIIAGLHFYFVRKQLGVEIQGIATMKLLSISLFSASITYLTATNFGFHHPLFLSCLFFLTLIMCLAIVKVFSTEEIDRLSKVNKRLANTLKVFAKQVNPSNLTDRQKWAYAWLPQSICTIDIGCSNSPLIELIQDKSKFTIGIDINHDALKSIPQQDAKIQLIQAHAELLPLNSECADVVLLLDVLEHTQDEKMVISEIHRALKPNGLLIMSIPYKGLFSFLDPQNLSHRIKSGKAGPIHKHYSEKDMRRLLFRLFKIEQKHYGGLFLYPVTFWAANFFKKRFGLDFTKFFKKLGDIDNDISWGKLSYNLIIKARKI